MELEMARKRRGVRRAKRGNFVFPIFYGKYSQNVLHTYKTRTAWFLTLQEMSAFNSFGQKAGAKPRAHRHEYTIFYEYNSTAVHCCGRSLGCKYQCTAVLIFTSRVVQNRHR